MVSKVITYGIIGVVAVGAIGFGVSHVAGNNKTEKVVTVGIVGTADNLPKMPRLTCNQRFMWSRLPAHQTSGTSNLQPLTRMSTRSCTKKW